MGFHRDRAVRHSARAEALRNLSPWLHLVDWNRTRLAKVEVEHTTQRRGLRHLVRGLGVGLPGSLVFGASSFLQ